MRTLDERLAVRFPALISLAARRVAALPVRSRLRRHLVARRTCQGYHAVNRGDLDVLLAVYHPDAVTSIDPATGLLPPDLGGEYRGHEGFRRLWEAWATVWDELTVEPLRLVDAGDRLAVSVLMKARGKGSGLATEMTYYEVYELREGRISRHQNFLRSEDARAAAGLGPQEWI